MTTSLGCYLYQSYGQSSEHNTEYRIYYTLAAG